jgi:RES domain
MSIEERTNQEPVLVDYPSDGAWRVARASSPLRFSWITAQDAPLSGAGNRFDVPGGGVLYTATDVRGCFTETLARFRPTARMRELLKDEDPDFMVCGGVPADWRLKRSKVKVESVDPLPFVDVEDPETLACLSVRLAPELSVLKVDTLDIGLMRGRNRLITRAVAGWAYQAADEDGEPRYSGLRYVSRLGDYECWAIFSGTHVRATVTGSIEISDPDMKAVADVFDLRVF